ncbi:MAG: OmpA family protein [Bacteroidetes bacterium]|nr:OmpA family protein [Bacteroidota bacterium]
MRRRRRHSEAHGQERWLLTYSDLITLLLGLFVILYAMSKIDTKKYTQWVAAFGGVFGSSQVDMKQGIGEKGLVDGMNEQIRVRQMIKEALELNGRSDAITVSMDERGVTIHIQEELLFPSGGAELKNSSLVTLDSLAHVFKRLPNDIRIEGHTDNIPINTPRFPSNWHLSVTRAMNTGYYLIGNHRMDPDKIAVVGYGDQRPLGPNDTERGRGVNRRVDIVIQMSAVTQTLDRQRQQAMQGG